MFRRLSRALVAVLPAVWLVAGLAAPVSAAVVDEAGYFSPVAVRRADEEIEQIQRLTGKDMVVETFKGVPEDQLNAVRSMNRSAREEFFARWAEERARARDVDGVYVLICKSPAHTAVALGPETEDRLFPAKDRERLARLLTPRFTKKQYDSELLDAVGFVRITLYANVTNPGGNESGGVSWSAVLLVIAGFLGLWLGIVVLRAVFNWRDTNPAAEPPARAAAVPDTVTAGALTLPGGDPDGGPLGIGDYPTQTYRHGPAETGDF
jgi:uncharacterized membrane protein YgcG